MGRYIDFIFQKSLLHYGLLVTQINAETSAKLFHKILSEMNWSPNPMDVTFIPSLCFISIHIQILILMEEMYPIVMYNKHLWPFCILTRTWNQRIKQKGTSRYHTSRSWYRIKFGRWKQNSILSNFMAWPCGTPRKWRIPLSRPWKQWFCRL